MSKSPCKRCGKCCEVMDVIEVNDPDGVNVEYYCDGRGGKIVQASETHVHIRLPFKCPNLRKSLFGKAACKKYNKRPAMCSCGPIYMEEIKESCGLDPMLFIIPDCGYIGTDELKKSVGK